jgi:hypothetical protein
MLGNNIAVIFWDGEPLNEISAARLHRVFADLTSSKKIEIKVFEGNDIAALAVQAATQEAPEEDPVKNACIFMGTFFKKQLSMASSVERHVNFSIALGRELTNARTTGTNPQLNAAVEILSNNPVPTKYRKEYNLSADIIEIIKAIDKTVPNR